MLGNFRNTFSRLALQLISENKPDSAGKALDKCLQVIPETSMPFDMYNILTAEAYLMLGNNDKANMLINGIKNNTYRNLDYYASLGNKYYSYLVYEKQVAFYTLDELRRLATTYNKEELRTEMEQALQKYANALSISM
jgi:tryptophan 2,3-dioxygenase